MRAMVPKTVYQTPNPAQDISECYTVWAEVLPEATDPKKQWVVKEKHGYWDERGQPKKFKHEVVTLGPTDPVHWLSVEEAQKAIDKQVSSRANQGFKYLFVHDFYDAPWFRRYEILSDGTEQEMPYPKISQAAR
jgi:hypothetical protein